MILAQIQNAKRPKERAMENEMKYLHMILPVELDDEILRILEEDDEDWDMAYAFNQDYPMN
jgi:hypothetical protein